MNKAPKDEDDESSIKDNDNKPTKYRSVDNKNEKKYVDKSKVKTEILMMNRKLREFNCNDKNNQIIDNNNNKVFCDGKYKEFIFLIYILFILLIFYRYHFYFYYLDFRLKLKNLIGNK